MLPIKVAPYVTQLLPVPFKFSGRDLQGMDCLGLVRYIYTANGIDLPDYAYDDWWLEHPDNKVLELLPRQFKQVDPHSVQEGDLLLFKPSLLELVRHIGIAINAHTYLHTTSSTGVVVGRIGNSLSRLLMAVRWTNDDYQINSQSV